MNETTGGQNQAPAETQGTAATAEPGTGEAAQQQAPPDAGGITAVTTVTGVTAVTGADQD
jgi:hypothetical protein